MPTIEFGPFRSQLTLPDEVPAAPPQQPMLFTPAQAAAATRRAPIDLAAFRRNVKPMLDQAAVYQAVQAPVAMMSDRATMPVEEPPQGMDEDKKRMLIIGGAALAVGLGAWLFLKH